MSGSEIENLIKLLSKMPGLGPRSAKRTALFLIKKKETVLEQLISCLKDVSQSVHQCSICGNFDSTDPCQICTGEKRDTSLLCVVQDVADLWAMERGAFFKGKYHVLGGVLSAIDGIGPEELNIDRLVKRVADEGVKEVILALSATVDGQITSHYITERLAETGVKVSGIAHGVPVGGELDFLDDGTIQTAIQARRTL